MYHHPRGASCCPPRPPTSSGPPSPSSAPPSTQITPVFYRRCSPRTPSCCATCSTAGTRPQGDQQRALAGSIAAFADPARHRGRPGPAPVLARIAHKHASLGVTEAQYQIVHEHLFAAIVEVLGDDGDARGRRRLGRGLLAMADALISIEKRLYAAQRRARRRACGAPVVVRRASRSRRTSCRSRSSRPTAARCPASGRVSTSRCGPTRGRRAPDPPVQPDRRPGSRRVGDHGQGGGREPAATPSSRPARSPTSCTTTSSRATRSPSPHPSATWCSTRATPPLVLVSAGIGVTPILGMLRHLRDEGSTREVLVVHARPLPGPARAPAGAQGARRRAARGEAAPVRRGPRPAAHRGRAQRRPGRPRRGRDPRERPGLPLRPAALHGVGP